MIRQRKDRDGLQVQVYAGRDPLTGGKRWVSRQIPGKGRAARKQARQVEAELLAEIAAGQHRGSKRLGHRAVLRLSWPLLVASVALSTLLQVAVAPPTLVGYLTAGATPVWLLGSFAVLSLLYHADTSADPATVSAEGSPKEPRASAEAQQSGAEVLTKRVGPLGLSALGQHRWGAGQRWAAAAAAGLSASYARALVAQFHARPATAL